MYTHTSHVFPNREAPDTKIDRLPLSIKRPEPRVDPVPAAARPKKLSGLFFFANASSRIVFFVWEVLGANWPRGAV